MRKGFTRKPQADVKNYITPSGLERVIAVVGSQLFRQNTLSLTI